MVVAMLPYLSSARSGDWKAISIGTDCLPSVISPRRWNDVYALLLAIRRSSGPSSRAGAPAHPAAAARNNAPRCRIIAINDRTEFGHCLPSSDAAHAPVD